MYLGEKLYEEYPVTEYSIQLLNTLLQITKADPDATQEEINEIFEEIRESKQILSANLN